jgi:hypothetical protein
MNVLAKRRGLTLSFIRLYSIDKKIIDLLFKFKYLDFDKSD